MVKIIIKPALILASVAFCSALLLSLLRVVTEPIIIQQEKEKEAQALMLVLPGYLIQEPVTVELPGGEKFTYWNGVKVEGEEESRGYAFLAVNYGYSGEIRSIVGVDEDNIILGISIIQQSETPGLGARVNELASSESIWGVILGRSYGSEGLSEPWFQEQFRGIDLNKKVRIVKQGTWSSDMKESLLSENAVTAITGATVTTKAITGSLKDGLIKLKQAKIISESGRNLE